MLDKFTTGTIHSMSNEVTSKFHEWLKKCHFSYFFRNWLIGRIGHALLVQPSKSNCSNYKNIFVLGSYEYVERMEGKFRDDIFSCVNKSYNYSVC